MSLPLPDGYVDTGVTLSLSASADARVWMLSPTAYNLAGGGDDSRPGVLLGAWALRGSFSSYNPGIPPQYIAWLDGPGCPADTILQTEDYAGFDIADSHFSDWYTYAETNGPYRLGVLYQGNVDAATPGFCQGNARMTYAWFKDEDTVDHSEVKDSGGSVLYSYDSSPVAPGDPPVSVGAYPPSFDFQVITVPAASSATCVEMRNIQASGVTVDTLGLDRTVTTTGGFAELTGDGGGALHATYQDGGYLGATTSFPAEWMRQPWLFDIDISVRDAADNEIAAELFDGFLTRSDLDGGGMERDPYLAHITCPFTHSYTIQNVSWDTSHKTHDGAFNFSLTDAWRLASDPVYPVTDIHVPVIGNPAVGGVDTHRTYRPVSLSIDALVDVFTSESDDATWVSDDTGKATVADPHGNSITVTTAGGSSLHRILRGSDSWRDVVGLGAGGMGTSEMPNPLLDLLTPGYEICVKDWAGYQMSPWSDLDAARQWTDQDTWFWGGYGFAQLTMTAPADCAVTLVVTYTHLIIDDPHTTGSDRFDTYEAGLGSMTETNSYRLNLASGTHTQDIDLLLASTETATADEPRRYISRVDKIELKDFSVTGAFAFGSLKLKRLHAAYFKLMFGPPFGPDQAKEAADAQAAQDPGDPHLPWEEFVTVNYDAANFSSDGSFPGFSFPDTLCKTETGGNGGGFRYCTIARGAVSAVSLDAQMSLTQFVASLNRIEGLHASYDLPAEASANSDGLGVSPNTLGEPLAQWIRPQLPGTVLPAEGDDGYPLKPECNPMCADFRIVAGTRFLVYARYHLGGGIEALAINSDRTRAGAGVGIHGVRSDDSRHVGTGTTDASGYVIVKSLPALTAFDPTGGPVYTIEAD